MSDSTRDLNALSDQELTRRIMGLLKKNCDSAGLDYPWKLVAYLGRHDGKIPTAEAQP